MRPIESGTPAMPIWIVGEAPGGEEVANGRPFVGASGQLLDRMLLETGFNRAACFVTNVCHERPPAQFKNGKVIRDDIASFFPTKTEARRQGIPEVLGRYPMAPVVEGLNHLSNLLAVHHPRLIIALGNTSLWALTGQTGILKWRGSIVTADRTPHPNGKVIPTIHPAAVLREWSLRNIVVQDLRRAKRESLFPEVRRPPWSFTIRPTLEDVSRWFASLSEVLDRGPITLAVDIETRSQQIACVGIARSKLEAICIPLMCVERPNGYWTYEEELIVVERLRAILSHPNCRCVFQNGAYDLQYFAKQLGFLPRISDDTMLMQHVCFPGLRKGLDFLSSLYCSYHRYWKDDGKLWEPGDDEEIHWRYNAEDCVRTFEVYEVLSGVVQSLGLEKQYEFQMKELFPIVLRMMLRGIKFDNGRRMAIKADLEQFVADANQWLTFVLGHPLNVSSGKQMQELIYEDLRIPVIRHRKTGNPTLDDEALDRIQRRNPLLRPLLEVVRNIRSANTALSNVLGSSVSRDARARCTYNLAGTETFRFSSAEDSFGEGFNMQNLTKGDEE